MANLSITAASVVPGLNAKFKTGVANAAAAQGDLAYYDETTNKYGLHDANSATARIRKLVGMFVDAPAADGAACTIQIAGQIALGSVLTVGFPYIGSSTPGKVCPIADHTGSGMAFNLIGHAVSATVLEIQPVYAPVAAVLA